jgi:hypothetical protein
MPRRLLVTFTALLVVFAASGCMKLDYGMDVSDSGAGTLTMHVELSEELSSMMDSMGGGNDAGDIESQMVDELPAEWKDKVSVKVDSSGDTFAFTATIKFDSTDELEQFVTGQVTGSSSDALFKTFSLTRDGDSWKFDATLSDETASFGSTDSGFSDQGSSDDSSPSLDSEGLDQLTQALMGDFEANISLTLPGSITDSNATEVDGPTATWKLVGDEKPPSRLTATSSPDGSFPSVAVGLLAVAGVLAVALVLLVLLVAFFGGAY